MSGLIMPGVEPSKVRTIIAVLTSGQTIIAQQDGLLWRHPCFIQIHKDPRSPKPIVAFPPLLMFAAKRDAIPAIPVGTGVVLCVTDPEPELAKSYEQFLVNLRAAASGLVAATGIPVDFAKHFADSTQGGRP